MGDKAFSLDAVELLRYQPNRYPFLLIDRVTEVVPGKYAKGFKNITNNDNPLIFREIPICLDVFR